MISISIDKASCINCQRCVRICTSRIFFAEEDKNVTLRNQELCIECGHCLAICPKDAISHSSFAKNRLHGINKEILPSADQILELMRSRRSNRAFSSTKEIAQEHLDKILEAAERAPTASNSQNVSFIVIKDKKIIEQISKYTIDSFCALANILDFPLVRLFVKPFKPGIYKFIPKARMLKKELDSGKDYILRGAKAVIFFTAPKQSMFAIEDANLAYQNASLVASSLSVAHFYTGFVEMAFKIKPKPLLKILSLDRNTLVCAGMALAMEDFEFGKYIDRKDRKITYF